MIGDSYGISNLLNLILDYSKKSRVVKYIVSTIISVLVRLPNA